MKNKKLAFIDIETTGFDVEKQEIIEIGLVIVNQKDGVLGDIVEEWEVKIQPEKIENADAEALALNGYNEAEWMFAVSLQQAMETFAEKTKDCVMVAHNVAFDYSFLAKAFSTTGVKNQMFFAKIDTISFAFAKLHKLENAPRLNLNSLCEYFGIENERAHTALADTRATVEVYRKLLEL